ncbi:hypothetical protein N9C62_08090 [Luminiphilus sp.]|nr:hypothetical protein [Luminiphilus sp.]
MKIVKRNTRMTLFFGGGIAISAGLMGTFLYSVSEPQSSVVSEHASAAVAGPDDLLLHDPTTGVPFLNRKYTTPQAPNPVLDMPAEAMLVVKDEVLTLKNESGPVAVFPVKSMKGAPRTIAATWLPQGPAPIKLGQIENVSPNNEVTGAVHALLPHPDDADILYLGSVNGGVWKTTNASAEKPTWTPLTDTASSLSIGALAFDTSAAYTTLWAGIGRNSSLSSLGGVRSGLMKSTDAGTSWTSVTGGSTLVGKNISGLVAHGDTIVVSVNTADVWDYPNFGIFRSTNGGNTFTQISDGTGTGLPGGVAFDLAQDPNDSSVLYTAITYTYTSSNGVYRSTDTGATWTKVSSSAMDEKIINGTTGNIEISVGLNTSAVNVGILNSGQLRNGGVFQSPTGLADSWVAMDTPLTNEGGGSVGTNPTYKPQAGEPGGQGAIHFSILGGETSTQVFVGGDRQPAGFEDKEGFPNAIGAVNFSGRLFRGDSSIAATGLAPSPQWKHLTHVSDAGSMTGGGTASSSSPHADSRDMAHDAAGDLIESDDGGIYVRTSPNSNTGDWFSINGNLQITEQHSIAYDPVSNIIISGNQDTGTSQQSTAGSLVWDTVSQADGGDVAVSINPANSSQSVRYSSFQNLGAFARRVYDAAGNQVGNTVYPALTVVGGGAVRVPSFVNPVVVNQVDATRLLLGGNNGLYESANQGDTITQLNSTPTIFGVGNALVYGGRSSGANNANLIYAATSTDGVIARRTLAGMDTTTVTGAGSLRGVMADPEEWKTVFVIDADQVFMSTDAGTSWTDITGDLVGSFSTLDIRGIEFIRIGTRGALLVGTLQGVYAAMDTDYTKWSLLGTGLPNTQVFDMDFSLGDDVLVAGTLGRGAWKISNVSQVLGFPPVLEIDPAVLWFILKQRTASDDSD